MLWQLRIASRIAAGQRSAVSTLLWSIGLWGPRICKAYEEMGIIGLADVDAEALQREDERVAERFDREGGLSPQDLQG